MIPKADADKIIKIFKHYMDIEGQTVDSMRYEKNIQEKMTHKGFLSDLNPLLPANAMYDVQKAYALIKNEIVDRIESTSK